ncbi:MAG: hypothetical protein GQ559_08990 [Desulfobulbaceae bacterium]|nr:hypothetical protein [Desulfobulbaceae bacterium]
MTQKIFALVTENFPLDNYLLVDFQAEDEKGEELPILRKVPQMLAADWGGTGTVVRESTLDYDEPQVLFSRAPSPKQEHRWRQQTTPDSFIYKCNRLHTKWLRPVLQIESFDDLLDCDLPVRILDALEVIAEQYDPKAPEELIVLAFLWRLTQSAIGGEFSRNTMRAIKKSQKGLRPDERLINLMAEAFADISKNDWGPDYPLENENNPMDDAIHE